MAQLTAVEWMVKGLIECNYISKDSKIMNEFIKKTKAMEKEQMHKCASFWRGKENEIEKPMFDLYYNETYNK
jgi:hypothetical protein